MVPLLALRADTDMAGAPFEQRAGRPHGPYRGRREELLATINARLTNLAERSPTDEQIARWHGDLT